jgi:VanZ family protein
MKTGLKYYGPAILWALFVLVICAVNLNQISRSPLFFPGFDKLAHCGLIFVMVVLSYSGFSRQQSTDKISYKALALITLAAILYGGIIELLQLWIFTWRSGEWDDLFADTVGALMGFFGIIVTIRSINYVKK